MKNYLQNHKLFYLIPEDSKLAISRKNLSVLTFICYVVMAAVPIMFAVSYSVGTRGPVMVLYYSGMFLLPLGSVFLIRFISKKDNYYLHQMLLIAVSTFFFCLLFVNVLATSSSGDGIATVYIGCVLLIIGFEITPFFHMILMSLIMAFFHVQCISHGVYYTVLVNNDIMCLCIIILALYKRRALIKRETLRYQIEEQNRQLEVSNIELERQTDSLLVNRNKLEEYVHSQKDEIRFQNERMIRIQNNTIVSLSNLVENRDEDTGGHVLRTRDYVGLIAMKAYLMNLYPELDEKMIRLFVKAAPMHDIGKIVVPDAVLKKPGRLTPEEFDQIKLHTVKGGEIVESVLGAAEDADYVRVTKEIATSHHEKYDGTGYPYGLSGNDIPLGARIMAIADVYDALVSPRCYKEPMSEDDAFMIISQSAGSHFDPQLARLFVESRDEVVKIHAKYV